MAVNAQSIESFGIGRCWSDSDWIIMMKPSVSTLSSPWDELFPPFLKRCKLGAKSRMFKKRPVRKGFKSIVTFAVILLCLLFDRDWKNDYGSNLRYWFLVFMCLSALEYLFNFIRNNSEVFQYFSQNSKFISFRAYSAIYFALTQNMTETAVTEQLRSAL